MTQIQESPPIEKENLQTPSVVLEQDEESREQEDDLSSSPSSSDRKDFAAMNGVNIEIEAAKPQSSILEPEEIITTRAVSQNPLLKIAVISGGILVFIMLIGGVINGSMNALNMGSTKKIEPSKNSQEIAEEPVKDETGQTKTALALTSQNVKFQEIRDHQAQSSPTSTPSPTLTPVAVAPPPTTRPIQRTQPISVSRNPIPPTRSSPVFRPQPQSQPVTRITPIRMPTVISVKTPTLDPMQQWLAAANIGSFRSSVNSDDELLKTAGIEGGIGESADLKNETTAQSIQSVNYNAKRVLVGSIAEGTLQTPIGWGTGDNVTQSYLIRISKPLKASDGTEVLPIDSYLVAQLTNSNNSGFAQLHGISVLINSNGDTQEKKLPENAVLIMSKNGSFLKAESQRGRDLGSSFMSAVIAGVAKAAEIQNRPKSQTNINSIGFSSSTTINDDKSLAAGFGEGAFTNLLEGIKASNERQSEELKSQEKVFVINAGKTVQIFVNQSIQL
jgi:Bacterial conjugation TrbI-like protein